jgi:hypothetical protein
MAQGKTAKFYKENPDAAAQHRRYMRKYNQDPLKIKYRSELNKERRKRGMYGNGGNDLSHDANGNVKPENPKKNRARNGQGDNKRYR